MTSTAIMQELERLVLRAMEAVGGDLQKAVLAEARDWKKYR